MITFHGGKFIHADLHFFEPSRSIVFRLRGGGDDGALDLLSEVLILCADR